MTTREIRITAKDMERLRELIDDAKRGDPRKALELKGLESELDRAILVDDQEIPGDVVRMGSEAHLVDEDTGEEMICKLVFPGEADIRLPNATHVSGTVSGVVLNGRRDYTSSDGGGNRMMMYLYALNTNNPPRNIRLWLPDPADAMNRSLAPPAGMPGQRRV